MGHPGQAYRAVDKLIAQGPMPLAQLARRARNAKTGTAVLQNAAHYLGEATAAMAASYWLGRASEAELPTAVRVQLRNVLQRGASFGTWVGLWREAAATAGGLGALSSKLADVEPLAELANALESARPALGDDGKDLERALARAQKRGVIGFFEFLATFRNKIYGHGTMLSEATCRALALPVMEAVSHVAQQAAVFDGDGLARSALDVLHAEPTRYWLRLSGLSERREQADAPAAASVEDGGLCFLGRERVTRLSFWVVQDEDATGLSRFGFFQRAPRKRRPDDGAFKHIEYLDYLSGRFRHEGQLVALEEHASAWLEESAVDAATQASSADAHTDEPDSAEERRFGDFVVEAELGRGAMGIVYRARQLSLNRIVALKVLPPGLLSDSVALGRFHREVQALARCDHPNVVRVLTSGIERSRPWFAMELVEGADLSEVFATLASWKGHAPLNEGHLGAASASLRDRRVERRLEAGEAVEATDGLLSSVPLETPELPALDAGSDDGGLYARLAELFAEAAEGVEEIHRRGVLHRDIKPANLMLSADGGRLVVMDLGLAKMSDASVSYTTASGSDFVGSARYAAPEQLQAKLLDVDQRADVYSLAATLYELATQKPLYSADEIPALLQQKLNDDPAPARQVEPSVPRDLETILQKALSRRPDDRYRSAEDLASDLRAFAEARPIVARPPSPFEYLRLFYLRQKRLVMVGAGALAALLALGVGSFFLVNEQRRQAIAQRDRASRAAAQAAEERDRAERLAVFIADDVYGRLAPIGKLDLLDDVSQRVVDHYATRDHSQPEVALRYARAVLRAAEVNHLRGRVQRAHRGYQDAVTLLSALIDAPSSVRADAQKTLAQAQHQVAGVHLNQNDLSAALTAATEALEVRRSLVESFAEHRGHRHELVRSERLMGVVRERQGQRSKALAHYRRAVEIGDAMVASDATDEPPVVELGRNLINVGDGLESRGDLDEALAHYERSLATLGVLAKSDARHVEVQRLMATGHDSAARIHRKQGRDEAARTAYEEALRLRQELVSFDPSRAGWQRDLAASLGHIAFIGERSGDLDRAQAAYQQSIDISRRLVARDESNIRWQMDVAVTQANLAGVLERRGDLVAAHQHFLASLATRAKVVDKEPSNAEYRHQLAVGQALLAGTLVKQRKYDEAVTHADASIEQFDKLERQQSDQTEWQRGLVEALRLRAAVADARGVSKVADQHRQRALVLARALEGDKGDSVEAIEAAIAKAKAKRSKPPGLVQEPIVSRSRKGYVYE
jgi:eukaryotic-like serine/threonine-protein kinase